MMDEKAPKLAYLLPNLFTAASIFLGVISILASVRGEFDKAIIFIVLSLVFDGLDGRVARFTHTTSKFGVEFDSLADVIAFGVAPALLFYYAIGIEYGRIGVLVSALYIIFGAIRLARFNVTTGTYDPSVFIGLPIPTAAIATAFWVGVYIEYEFVKNFGILYIVSMAVLSFLMVSNIRYPSFKKIDLRNQHFKKVLVLLVVVCSLIYLQPIEVCAFFVGVYVFYGICRVLCRILIAKFKSNQ